MLLGYSWTGHLRDLLSLPDFSNLVKRAKTDEEALILLEALSILDLDLWVIGKKTASKHIWIKCCRGRPGIERVTGLPRPLLDIIALACRDSDAIGLRRWLATSRIENMNTSLYHVCQAYATASILYLYTADGTLPHDLLDLCRVLEYHIHHFREELSTNTGLSARQIVWPSFILGNVAPDKQTRQFVREILADKSLQYGVKPYGRIIEILEEMWARVDTSEYVTPSTIVEAQNLELGIW